jgi:hypothetical protein
MKSSRPVDSWMQATRWIPILALLACTSCGYLLPAPPTPQPEDAAAQALQELVTLVDAGNYRDLGFDTVGEVRRAGLGQPMAVFDVRLDGLKTYVAGQSVDALLARSPETIYPVVVDNTVKSSVVITRGQAGYTPAEFGRAFLVRRAAPFRHGQGGEFIVRIAALNSYFLGRRDAGGMELVPIAVNPQSQLTEGAAIRAPQVFEALVPFARAYRDGPA